MDEEDFAEFRDAQKLVDENEEMDLTGGTQAELRAKANAAETGRESVDFFPTIALGLTR